MIICNMLYIQSPIYIPLLSEVFTEICPLGKQIIVELKGNREDLGPRV